MNEIATRLLIRGRVQGVGYRAWFTARAKELGLKGWVRNLKTGEVEAVIQGPASLIEELAAAAKEGPLLARVDSVQATPHTPIETFRNFEIKRD